MEKEWYVVNTVSGHEYKVKEKLEMRINSMDLQENIFRVIVPEQKEIEYKNGVKKEKVKKMFPGYVLVEMVMSDEAWYIVRNTQGVTGFIGSSGKGAKPIPLLPQEVDRILNSMGMSRVDISKDLTEGNLDNDNTYPKAPKFFVKDSLNTISYAVKSNNTSKYKVGDTKIIYQT